MDDRVHALHPRAAGLDVHKMAITATIRLALPGGERDMRVPGPFVGTCGAGRLAAGEGGRRGADGGDRHLRGSTGRCAGRGRHRTDAGACPAGGATQGPQDRCRRQCLAGAAVPVWPGLSEPGGGPALPGPQGPVPLPAFPGPSAQPGAVPDPEDHLPRRDSHRRHSHRHLRWMAGASRAVSSGATIGR